MEIIEFIKIVLLGIVEGITEWLPISSTGHMLLFDEFFPVKAFLENPDFGDLFIVVIQLGAILAVVLLFWNKIWPFRRTETGGVGIRKEKFILWTKIAVACVPIGIVGLLLEDRIDEFFYQGNRETLTIALALIFYGIMFIGIEALNKKKKPRFDNLNTMPYQLALYIGMFQCLAVIPGTSRSGATILGAMILGSSRIMAAEFTFFLAIPTMAGASLLKLIKYGFAFSGQEYAMLITGMIVAFLVSFFCIKLLMQYISRHSFAAFGWYRIALGLFVFVYYVGKYALA